MSLCVTFTCQSSLSPRGYTWGGGGVADMWARRGGQGDVYGLEIKMLIYNDGG